MFWNKKKPSMKIEDFWLISIGEMINDNSCETDVFQILFPNTVAAGLPNRSELLSKSGLSKDNFRAFYRLAMVSAVCANAYIDTPQELSRIPLLSKVPRQAEIFQKECANLGLDLDDALIECHRSFLSQTTKILPEWAISSSETFGAFKALKEPQKSMAVQAGVAIDFLMDYCSKRSKIMERALGQEPAVSRDCMAVILASMRRMQLQLKSQFEII